MRSLTVSVVTLGCKVNQCESSSIVAELLSHNYSASEGLFPADVFILNTCSVTAEADKKSRQYLAKMRRLKPDCRIIVVGCSSQNAPKRFYASNVIAVGGTTGKCSFVLHILDKIYNDNLYSILSDRIVLQEDLDKITQKREYCEEISPISNKTRAFIKIQDGCNRFCTYCIIPYLRGRSRSRSVENIVEECKKIDSMEIVLTGIDISSYGIDIGTSLPFLIGELSRFPARKRLGSLECEAVSDELLATMRDGGFCPHFHLSLQSGDNDILKSMNRHYDCDYYFEKILLIRKYFPLAGITTDVIAGFPTETDERFDNCCEFIKMCAFSDIHVFPYSAREGTLASRKYSVLPPPIVKSRVNRLLEIKHELIENFMRKNIGTIAPVYVEDSENGYNVGYTPNYIKVYSNAPCGEITQLKLTELFENGMLGKPV